LEDSFGECERFIETDCDDQEWESFGKTDRVDRDVEQVCSKEGA